MNRQRISRRDLLKIGAAAGAVTLAGCAAPAAAPQQPTTAPAAPATGVEATTAPEQAPAEAPAAPLAAGEIEYFMYDLGPANKSREEMRDAFQAANPDAKVRITVLPYGELWQKIAARMAAGQPPDVMYGDFSLVRSALEGQLLDMTSYMKADSVLSDSNQFTIEMMDPMQAKYGTSKVVALIMGTWVPILYFNKDLFDVANVAYPTEDWTWEEVREAAMKLTKDDRSQFGVQIGVPFDNVGWMWWGQQPADFWATPQAFPETSNFNNETGINVFRVYYDLTHVDKSAPTPDEASGYSQYAGPFGAGKSAMYTGGDWDAGWSFRELPFKWDMTLTPKMRKDYRPSLNTMVATNTIASATKNPDIAWNFVRFISASKEGQTLVGAGAYETPVLKGVAESDEVLKPDWAPEGYSARVKAALLPGPMFTPYPLNINLWEFPGKFLDPTVDNVRKGEMTPEQAVEYLDKEGKPYFAQQKKDTPPIP
jgi:multiple sugar transport system substrate-binding protein